MPAGKQPLSMYGQHKAKWKDGCGSDHCAGARHRVLARGTLPCDVLFVGEAPGFRENDLGLPFVGDAGYELDRIVRESVGVENSNRGMEQNADGTPAGTPLLTVAFTNVVGCIPLQEDRTKFKDPDYSQVLDCSGRLQEFVLTVAVPRLLVACGKVAFDAFDPKFQGNCPVPDGCRIVKIDHPAHVVRAPEAQRGLLHRKAVATLTEAVEETFT